MPADVDESARSGEGAVPYAQRIARDKADKIADGVPDRWLLAADTVVEIDGDILGKPADAGEALAMLTRLLGKVHRVTTAFVIRGPNGALVERAITTDVTMRDAGADEAQAYVDGGEWRGKAGGYAVQGMAAAFVTGVSGSITNVIGLPLAEALAELQALGAVAADYVAGVPA